MRAENIIPYARPSVCAKRLVHATAVRERKVSILLV